jgi:hypothetical protein
VQSTLCDNELGWGGGRPTKAVHVFGHGVQRKIHREAFRCTVGGRAGGGRRIDRNSPVHEQTIEFRGRRTSHFAL